VGLNAPSYRVILPVRVSMDPYGSLRIPLGKEKSTG
jgi:hypothetical protein